MADGEIEFFGSIQPGVYTITEDDPGPNYNLIDIDCQGTVDKIDVDILQRSVTVETSLGQAVACNFVNEKVASISMRKVTDPPSSVYPPAASAAFGYTMVGPDQTYSSSFGDGDTASVSPATPGEWVLSETLPGSDWQLTDIRCTSAKGTSTFSKEVDQLRVTVELAADDDAECTFGNYDLTAPRHPYYLPMIINTVKDHPWPAAQ